MKIAVVSAYYREPVRVIQRCIESVVAQTQSCTHILVADGHALSVVDDMPVQHIRLPCAHEDCGDTPRLIGAASAHSQGFEAMLWLDIDNTFAPDHVERMLLLAQDNAVPVVTSARSLVREDGSLLGVCEEVDGESFTDTSCYLLMRQAMVAASAWGFKDRRNALIGDRVLWAHIKRLFPRRVHNAIPSVNYTTKFAVHYLSRGEAPPGDAKMIVKRAGESHHQQMLYRDYLATEAEPISSRQGLL